MKKLIITRHAKSEWGDWTLSDFDRSLNDRGRRDAPEMGRRLREKQMDIDLIVSSTAKRAAETALLIAAETGYDKAHIVWTKDLYHAPPERIMETIFAIDDKYDNVMIVCHNPGITQFVNMQCGFVTDNVPTCGITAFEIDGDRWQDYALAGKKLLFHDFPKNA